MIQPSYYYMKRRLGGEHLTVRDKLLWHRMHLCPGCIAHDVPRAEIIFDNWVGRGNKAYSMYWRCHKEEYNKIRNR